MEIIKKYLPDNQYYNEEARKTQICLHHTASAEADPAYNWWKITAEHIAAAYLIDKDGTIFECFNPVCWAWHIGRGSTKRHNMQSIAIELVNEGWLTKKGDNYYWYNGQFKYYGKDIIKKEYREQIYWPAYPELQLQAAAELTASLCRKFAIPGTVYTDYSYNAELLNSFTGIYSHCNVRKDKTDISPAFNLKLFQSEINKLMEAK